jgi:cysteine-rich repeat protein
MRLSGRSCLFAGIVVAFGCGGGGSDDGDDGGIDAAIDGPPAVCGNGTIETGEECDDGNTAPGDGCDAACDREPPPNCGDGNVDYADGEECDDGNTAPGDGCDDTCALEAPVTCGNGALDLASGEECDDGNTSPGDGCSPSCQLEPVGAACGNATMEAGETCDDGNTVNGDTCNPTCNFANTTSVFVGSPGMPGRLDGIGTAARVTSGVITADATNLWFTDGVVVRRIDIATATVTTIAGDITGGMPGLVDDPVGLNARFMALEAIATDGTTIWVADASRIRAITVAPPHAVTTVAGQAPGAFMAGIGTAARFGDLRGLTYYAGHVYFVDAVAGVLGRFDPADASVVPLAGTPGITACPPAGTPMDGVGAAAVMCSPRYIASDNSGNLFVADTNGNTIRRYNTVTTFLGTYAGTGACGYADGTGTAAAIHRPRGMTSDGTSLYIAEFNAHTIRQGVVVSGEVSTMIGTPAACTLTCSCPMAPAGGYAEGVGAAAQLANPWSITYHFPSRSLFWVDNGNAVIRRVQ